MGFLVENSFQTVEGGGGQLPIRSSSLPQVWEKVRL